MKLKKGVEECVKLGKVKLFCRIQTKLKYTVGSSRQHHGLCETTCSYSKQTVSFGSYNQPTTISFHANTCNMPFNLPQNTAKTNKISQNHILRPYFSTSESDIDTKITFAKTSRENLTFQDFFFHFWHGS